MLPLITLAICTAGPFLAGLVGLTGVNGLALFGVAIVLKTRTAYRPGEGILTPVMEVNPRSFPVLQLEGNKWATVNLPALHEAGLGLFALPRVKTWWLTHSEIDGLRTALKPLMALRDVSNPDRFKQTVEILHLVGPINHQIAGLTKVGLVRL